MYLSIYFQAKLNEPGINLNGFLFKLAGKTYSKKETFFVPHPTI